MGEYQLEKNEVRYNKLYLSIHTKYGFNISDFLSTSSLTFYLWKLNIRGKFDIALPTLQKRGRFSSSGERWPYI